MTEQVGSDFFNRHMAVLVYGGKLALFTELLTFLAVISIVMWGAVFISTLIRFSMQHFYKRQTRRSVHTKA